MVKEKKNLKALLILGNGFDLACGYKTKFEHFYEDVMKTNSEFKDHNFFIQLLRETFYVEGLEEMRKFLKIDSKDNWMDIELLLNHFLLGDAYSCAKEAYDRVIHHKSNEYHPLYPRIVFHNWISMALSNYSKNFIEFLMSHLKAFEDKLCEYLMKDSQAKLYDETKVDFIFIQLTENVSAGKVINFNYTNPWDEKENFHICYVHGSMYEKNAIIGIDSTINDKEVLSMGEINKFTKTFRKIRQNTSVSETERVLEKGIDKIIFYGHSLGEQDYSYFQSIFDFYDLYNSDIILEFGYSEYDKNKSERDIVMDRIYKLINLYGKTLDNKEHGKNLLHKLLLEKRISIKKIVMPDDVVKKYISEQHR